jgi:DNA-directed RNA polymerase subunit RPC12/RpoP
VVVGVQRDLDEILIDERLAKKMLAWTHSGFSLDLTVKIPTNFSKTRVGLAEYIPRSTAGRSPARGARPPLSLKKLLVEEHGGSVLYRSEYNPYVKTDRKRFPAIGFLVDLLQHLPDAGAHMIRRYGLYSSCSRGTWSRKPYLVRLAPGGWKEQHGVQSQPQLAEPDHQEPEQSVSAKEARSAWARLIGKVYEADRLRCPRCGSKMKVKAVITDPQQVRRILRHLVKTGAGPPDLDLSSLS